MENTLFICHRINNSDDLKKVERKQGIELDLRDKGNRIILSHDPFNDGEDFEDFLKKFNKKLIILNIKSERIEYKVLELLRKYNVQEYFFLDSSFPMIYQLNKINEKNIAIRFSEFETIESVEKVKNMVKWVWIDCFNNLPLDKKSYTIIKKLGLKICLVSPELQGHDIKMIDIFKKIIKSNNFQIDAICTKSYNIEYWKK
jgi:hypothetical protein